MRFTHLVTVITLTAGLVQAQNSSANYRISVVDGEGALNTVGGKAAREPVIQVSDVNHHPVADAYVEFDAPVSGPGAAFANGSTHFATTTNAEGLAVGSKITNNGIPGAYLLQVRVSFEGRSIGELQIHQTNVARNASSALPQSRTSGASSAASSGANTGASIEAPSGASIEVPGSVMLSNNVVGIALGDTFLVNGAYTPSNANLLKGTRIQTLEKPTTLYLHDRCEYILAPHSAVMLAPKVVTLESGSVRARRFGDCRILFGGLFITGAATSDGVATLTGQNLDVASVGGSIRVVNGAGDIISTVNPGSVSSFGTSTVASGASIGGVRSHLAPFKEALLLGGVSAVALAGLGLASDAILQPNSSTPPTSP